MPLLQIVIGSSDPDPALVAVMAQALAWTSNQSSIGSPSAWTSNPHSKRSSWPSVVNGRSNGEDGSSSHARHTHFHRVALAALLAAAVAIASLCQHVCWVLAQLLHRPDHDVRPALVQGSWHDNHDLFRKPSRSVWERNRGVCISALKTYSITSRHAWRDSGGGCCAYGLLSSRMLLMAFHCIKWPLGKRFREMHT